MYVTSPELGPDAKHPQKWYQKSEGAPVMRMDTTKKGNKKNPAERVRRRGPQAPSPGHHTAYDRGKVCLQWSQN